MAHLNVDLVPEKLGVSHINADYAREIANLVNNKNGELKHFSKGQIMPMTSKKINSTREITSGFPRWELWPVKHRMVWSIGLLPFRISKNERRLS